MSKKIISFLLALSMLLSMAIAANAASSDDGLKAEWTKDQVFVLADPAPWNLGELKQVVDVKDPRSVAAYWVWAVNRLVDNYDDGMEMMKYLFADIEPFGAGYTEGGMSGKAGWDSYFNERLKDANYKWLPRAYFDGSTKENGFVPTRPLSIELYYNAPNTQTINEQTLASLGRLNIVFWVKSYAGGNQVNINISKFDGSDRWYVTSGTSSTTLFYQQVGNNLAKTSKGDTSTAEEHSARYGKSTTPGTTDPTPGNTSGDTNIFVDVDKNDYFYEPVQWAYENDVTKGTSDDTFGPEDKCTRGQVATFLWRAAGCPEPESSSNPFNDVSQSDYFYKAVLWAVEQGITSGTSDNTFSPNETCSSAHIITFLYRANGGDNGWYQEAKMWAEDAGLITGTGINVDPEELCPRGAVVTFLYRNFK